MLNNKITIIGIFILSAAIPSVSQSRMYLLATFNGGTEELGAWYYDDNGKRIGYLTKFGKPGIEIAWEKRIAGSMYAYMGVNYAQYESAYNEAGISLQSQVSQSFLSFPLLLRFNAQNRNIVYLDFGVMPTYLTKANLKESDSFDPTNTGKIIKDEGNVSSFIPRFGIMYKIASSVAINRFVVGYYVAVNLANVGNGDLPQNWKVNSSIFMSYNSKPIWATYGLNLGFRIK
ncbi:MAG: hypothetical protein JNM78_11495 [Cyclobacteriaceae bacterium]|nr:hypothetical protein [Cyclobacteriaceae bacterium]